MNTLVLHYVYITYLVQIVNFCSHCGYTLDSLITTGAAILQEADAALTIHFTCCLVLFCIDTVLRVLLDVMTVCLNVCRSYRQMSAAVFILLNLDK